MKEFSAKVPDDEYERFVKLTDGIYGSTTWFINTALKEFNDRLEGQPSRKELVQESVASFLSDRKEVART